MPLRLRPFAAAALLCLTVTALQAQTAPVQVVAACTDFYSHANAPWLQANPLPVDQPSLSRWTQLDAAAQQQLQTLLTTANPADGPASAQLAAFNASLADEAHAIASGQRALKAILKPIRKLRSTRDLAKLQAALNIPGGVGLPDPAFYTQTDPAILALAADYRALLATLLALTGDSPATAATNANAVWALESQLAPGTSPASLAQTPATHWQAWLRVRAALTLAPVLGPTFHDPVDAFYQIKLAGKPARNRIQWLADELLDSAPDLFDAAYQERYLDAARRERVQHMAEALRTAQAQAITNARWLSAEGKSEAQQRLSALRFEIGRTPSDPAPAWPTFLRDDAAKNLLSLHARPATASTGGDGPVRQWQPLLAWLPATGQLVISTAALQPPLLAEQPGPGDFGSLGALIGQQLGHAFQTWNGADARAWQARSRGLIAQYSRYPVTTSLRVNGNQTFAQNQADLAGIELAWSALQANGGTDAASAQAFFTAWASLWARQDRDPARAAVNAAHAPARWRVNGPLLNFPAFAKTYGCKGRDAMLRPTKDQIALWR